MERFNDPDGPLQKAFRLAYFIHPDKVLALQVVAHALCRLDVSVSKQNKRGYYPLEGHKLSSGLKIRSRSKVSLKRYQQLQLLIYRESDSYERCQEISHTALTEEDFIIRFIKHLVRITVERSSFYVTLGLSRLLYTYATQETTNIYNFVMQGSERVKDEDYYRKQKGVLMREIHEHFGNLLKVCRAQKGEKRFETQKNSRQYVQVVKDCLNIFTLWYTPCVLPERLNQMKESIAHLHFKDNNPDKEYPIEINRIHTLLHPKCFAQVVAHLGLASPDDCLAIPMFFHSNGNAPHSDRRNPPLLQKEDIAMLRSMRTGQAIRRKDFFARSLSIFVDGIERAKLDTFTLRHVQFEVTDRDRLIEVKGCDAVDDILLASHLLIQREMQSGESPLKYTIVLEAGQEISVSMQPLFDSEGDFAGAKVECIYRETNLVRKILFSLQQIQARVPISVPPVSVLRALFVFIILVACLAGVITYVNLKKQAAPLSSSRNSANENEELPALSNPLVPAPDQNTVVSSKAKQEAQSSKLNRHSSKETSSKNSSTQAASSDKSVASDTKSSTGIIQLPAEGRSIEEGTRGIIQTSPDTLRSIKRVYVESPGSDPVTQRLRARLISGFKVSERFTITEEPESADAILFWSVSHPRVSKQMNARLVNTRQEGLWSTTYQIPSRTNSTRLLEYAGKIIEQLLKDIEVAEK